MNQQEANIVERGAFAIYRQFIRGGVGTVKPLFADDGQIITDGRGKPLRETYDQAALRRWNELAENSRESYRQEAIACLRAVS